MTLLASFSTEILILVGLFSLLAVDLCFLRKKDSLLRSRILGLLASFWIVLGALPLLGKGPFERIYALGGMWIVDPLVVFVKLTLLAITLVTILLSMEKPYTSHVSEYYALIFTAALGMLFLVSAEDLLMIFVALELLSVSLYVLTAFHEHTERSQEAAVKYFLFGALSSGFLYFGISYLYGLSGTTNLAFLGESLRILSDPGKTPPLLWVAVTFILVGLGFKLAVVPFHLWAPDAYEGAPTPITAYISTGSKLASFFILLKILFLSMDPVGGSPLHYQLEGGWAFVLAVVASLSMTLGNLVAMTQKNLKRLFAYSSIAHAGYILVGVVAATKLGISSVLYYLVIYAFTNLGAFGVIAAVSAKAGGDALSDFSGLGKRSPFLACLMVIFVLSLAGIPPLAGFFGKFYVFLSAVGRDIEGYGLMWLVVIGVANSAISLYYYLKILKQMYIIEPADPTPIPASRPMVLALLLSVCILVGLGLYPTPLLSLLKGLLTHLPLSG